VWLGRGHKGQHSKQPTEKGQSARPAAAAEASFLPAPHTPFMLCFILEQTGGFPLASWSHHSRLSFSQATRVTGQQWLVFSLILGLVFVTHNHNAQLTTRDPLLPGTGPHYCVVVLRHKSIAYYVFQLLSCVDSIEMD
jgi:hypothetical protein